MKRLLILLLIPLLLFNATSLVFADPSLDDQLTSLEKQIQDLSQQKQSSENATKPLESELTNDNNQIADFNKKIASITAQIEQKKQDLAIVEKNIGYREEELTLEQARFVSQVQSLYIHDRAQIPLSIMLSANNEDASLGIALDSSITKENMTEIGIISGKIGKLQTDKQQAQQEEKDLQSAQARLATDKAKVDDRANFLSKTIADAKQYQAVLSAKIADLSQQQQNILAAKNGSFTTSVGDVPLADDPTSQPGYNPGFSPAFAAFSFGAFTHRKGMSQYGAKGRAEAGQNANQILQAYYGKSPVNHDTGGNINVSGAGSMSFEDKYLMGIAEMPSSFPMEALKAQAIAARTYAYRYKQNGQSICTDESCQVYSSSKADSPPDAWRQAVQATKGQVIDDVVTYYSSTTGGYVNPLGWDTTDGQGGPGFASRAWESKAGSPWFYKAWYTQSYSTSSSKCGRSSPWLTQEEMGDILNAYLIQGKGGVDNSRIVPTTTSCWSGNPYSIGEMRDLANSVGGGAVTTISDASVNYGNDGTTSSVTFSTNRGSISIGGSDFKQIYNLRAPGYTSIKSVLFNMVKK